MKLGLEGRRAIVTGGTKGIGRAVLDELRAEGVAVAFCARNADDVASIEDELGAPGGPAVFASAADVTDADQAARFIPGPRKGRVLAGQQACEGSFCVAGVVP